MKLHKLLEAASPLRTTMLKLQQRVIDEVDDGATFKFINHPETNWSTEHCTMQVKLSKYAEANADGEYEPTKYPAAWLDIYADWDESRVRQAYDYFLKQVRDANPKLKKNKADHLNILIKAAWPHLTIGDKDSGTAQKPTGFWC